MKKISKIWKPLLILAVLFSGCKNASFLKQRYTHNKRIETGTSVAANNKKLAVSQIPMQIQTSPLISPIDIEPEMSDGKVIPAAAARHRSFSPIATRSNLNVESPKYAPLKIKVAGNNTKRGPLGWLIDTVFGIIFSIVIVVAIVLLIVFLLL